MKSLKSKREWQLSFLFEGHVNHAVTIPWHTQLELIELHLNVNWAVDIEININNKTIVILNVFTPYKCHDNEHEDVSAIIVGLNTICVCVVGEYNSDITDAYSLFVKHSQDTVIVS